MTRKNQHLLYTTAILILTGSFIYWGIWRKSQLKNQHDVVIGKIYSFSYNARGNAGCFFVNFRYQIKEKEYCASKGYLTSDFHHDEEFVQKHFPIVYNSQHPSIASILIIPADFAQYNFIFPDSLNWVRKYIR